MKYDTLEQILEYVINNKINLTVPERKFLLKLQEPDFLEIYNGKIKKINLKDFIKWCHSPLRNKNITKALLTQDIKKKELTELLDLTNEEINQILNRYSLLTPDILGYLTVSYAKLKAYQKNLEIDENYPQELLSTIALDPENARKNNIINLILNNVLYFRKDIIEKMVANKNERVFDIIDRYLEKYKDSNEEISKIIAKYIELELDGKNKERIYPWGVEEAITTASRRPRAIKAVLRQDSPQKMNQVIFAAANNGIYRNKKLFSLVQRQDDEEKMQNLREIGRINRLRKYPEFLEWFATIDTEKQRTLIQKIYEEEEKRNQERYQKRDKQVNEKEEEINNSILDFSKKTTMKSAKRLVKTLQSSFLQYPILKEHDTTKRD